MSEHHAKTKSESKPHPQSTATTFNQPSNDLESPVLNSAEFATPDSVLAWQTRVGNQTTQRYLQGGTSALQRQANASPYHISLPQHGAVLARSPLAARFSLMRRTDPLSVLQRETPTPQSTPTKTEEKSGKFDPSAGVQAPTEKINYKRQYEMEVKGQKVVFELIFEKKNKTVANAGIPYKNAKDEQVFNAEIKLGENEAAFENAGQGVQKKLLSSLMAGEVGGAPIPGLSWLTFSLEGKLLEGTMDYTAAKAELALAKIAFVMKGTVPEALIAEAVGPESAKRINDNFSVTLSGKIEKTIPFEDLGHLAKMAEHSEVIMEHQEQLLQKEAELQKLAKRRKELDNLLDSGGDFHQYGKKTKQKLAKQGIKTREEFDAMRKALREERNLLKKEAKMLEEGIRKHRSILKKGQRFYRAAASKLKSGAGKAMGKILGKAAGKALAKIAVKFIPVVNILSLALDIYDAVDAIYKISKGAKFGTAESDSGIEDTGQKTEGNAPAGAGVSNPDSTVTGGGNAGNATGGKGNQSSPEHADAGGTTQPSSEMHGGTGSGGEGSNPSGGTPSETPTTSEPSDAPGSTEGGVSTEAPTSENGSTTPPTNVDPNAPASTDPNTTPTTSSEAPLESSSSSSESTTTSGDGGTSQPIPENLPEDTTPDGNLYEPVVDPYEVKLEDKTKKLLAALKADKGFKFQEDDILTLNKLLENGLTDDQLAELIKRLQGKKPVTSIEEAIGAIMNTMHKVKTGQPDESGTGEGENSGSGGEGTGDNQTSSEDGGGMSGTKDVSGSGGEGGESEAPSNSENQEGQETGGNASPGEALEQQSNDQSGDAKAETPKVEKQTKDEKKNNPPGELLPLMEVADELLIKDPKTKEFSLNKKALAEFQSGETWYTHGDGLVVDILYMDAGVQEINSTNGQGKRQLIAIVADVMVTKLPAKAGKSYPYKIGQMQTVTLSKWYDPTTQLAGDIIENPIQKPLRQLLQVSKDTVKLKDGIKGTVQTLGAMTAQIGDITAQSVTDNEGKKQFNVTLQITPKKLDPQHEGMLFGETYVTFKVGEAVQVPLSFGEQ